MLPIAEARARLSELVADAQATHQRFEITRNGRPAAVLIAADDFESMRETIEVLSDTRSHRAHQEGIDEMRAGRYLDADQLDEAMRRAGCAGPRG